MPGSDTATRAVENLDAVSTVDALTWGSTSDPHSLDGSKESGHQHIASEQHGTVQDAASYGRHTDMSFVSKTLAERYITSNPLNSSERHHEPYLVSQGSQPKSQILSSLSPFVTLTEDPSVLAQRSITNEVLPGHRDKRQRMNDSYIERHHYVSDRTSRDELQFRTGTSIYPYGWETRKTETNKKGMYGGNELQTLSTSSPSHEGNYIDTLGKPSPPTEQSVTRSRRLSINSLLTGSATTDVGCLAPAPIFDQRDVSKNAEITAATDMLYGVDQGLHDLDVPQNNDASVLHMSSPDFGSEKIGNSGETIESDRIVEFGFGIFGNNASSSDVGYYVQPVPVIIPKSLEPLPPILLENPMNLMYFHHFLNHTARILVPHDCSENPFKNILPQSELYFLSDMMVLVDFCQWLYQI